MVIDFWDYTCLNCLRTLPYLRGWHRQYGPYGLTIIGVHVPEFTFAGSEVNVSAAVAEHELPYPILLDSEQRLWDEFAVRAWPTKFLIDHDGYIRYAVRGEGQYGLFEQAIRQALLAYRPGLALPEMLEPLSEEDRPGAVCFRPTAEIYTGYARGAFWHGRLGNPVGTAADVATLYRMPNDAARVEGHFYLEGLWRNGPESVQLAEGTGRILIRYRGVTANVVIGQVDDSFYDVPGRIEIRQDGMPLAAAFLGADAVESAPGRVTLSSYRSRMTELVRNQEFGPHELELIVIAPAPPLYAFTFSGCVVPEGAEVRDGTYIVR